MRPFLLLLTVTFCLLASVASAEVYKYVNKDGTVGYTDSLQAVPEKQRHKATVVEGTEGRDGSSAKAKDGGTSGDGGQEAGQTSVKSPKEQFQALADAVLKKGYWKHIAVVAAGLILLAIIGRMSRVVGPKGAWTVLKIIVVLGLLSYFFYSYAGGLSGIFTDLKEKVLDVRGRIEKKQAGQTGPAGEAVQEKK